MAAKHWTGLVGLVVIIHLQVSVESWRLNLESEAAPAPVADTEEERDGVVCFSPDDCQLDECCLANVRPIGKRSARTKRWFLKSEGVCKKLGTLGSSCIVPFSGIPPDPRKEVIALDMCPCATEFNCVADPDAPIVVPQGKIGSCEAKNTEIKSTDEILQLLSDKDEDEAAADNYDAETNNDVPNEYYKVANDDNDKRNTDDAESILEEGEQTEREEEEEQREEEPLDNTIDDFPVDTVD